MHFISLLLFWLVVLLDGLHSTLPDCLGWYSGPAGGDGEAQGDVPVPGPDWPPAGLRANQPGGRQPTAQVSSFIGAKPAYCAGQYNFWRQLTYWAGQFIVGANLLRRGQFFCWCQPTAQVSLVVGTNLLRRSVHLLAPSQPTAQVSTIFGANLLSRSVHCWRQPTKQVKLFVGASLLRRSVQLMALSYCAGHFICWRQPTAQVSSVLSQHTAQVS